MALKDIRDKIVAILAAVDGVGVVHEYERWAGDWKKFLDLFKDADGKINGWIVTRRATPATRDTEPYIDRRHTMVMKGIYGLNDDAASELTFQAVVENIQNAFDGEFLLGGFAVNSGPVQVKAVEARLFGGVLCHYAELEYEVWEKATYS